MKRNIKTTRKSTAAQLFETLEGRQLMTAAPFVINGTAANDVITVNYGAALVVAPSQTATSSVATGTAKAATPAVSQAATRALSVVSIPTILNRLTYTVDGLSSTTYLATGQSIVVNGLAGNDKITVTGKINTQLNGGDGNDTLIGGTGADQFNGGAGTDTVDYSARTAGVSVTLDGVANDGQSGEGDNVGADVEIVIGGSGNDYFAANVNDATPRQYFGNAGNDTIFGGSGNDTIRGGSGNDFLYGAGGNDVIYTGSGSSFSFGGDGNDTLYAGTGPVDLYGGNGDDIIVSIGGSANDDAYGGAGNNSFWVGANQHVMDATAAEAKTNVHKVSAYDALYVDGNYIQTPPLRSGAVSPVNLVDPDADYDGKQYNYKNFSNIPLFGSSGPTENDINQGNADDCYFVAALSAVAKIDPNAIRQSVVDLGDGTYAVDFKKNGTDHFIRVNADLPVNANGNLENAHFGNGTQDLWVPILEKAWAFFRTGAGNYQSIGFGFSSEAFNALGISNSSYDPHHEGFLDLQSQNATDFGNEITSLLQSGNAVVLGTGDNSMYLDSRHEYVVDHVSTVNGKLIITVRNPWGTDGPGGNGANDGYIDMTSLDVLESIDQVTYGKA
ncbi:MAG TPA: C2 family cysteine protease [Tepidisphaeraceae bacterium]|nr:C2 family cysteine protease [Tepidisphaeraceae bacterium]